MKAGSGAIMQIGNMLKQWLTRLEWYDTLFPRIPVPIQNEINMALRNHFGDRDLKIGFILIIFKKNVFLKYFSYFFFLEFRIPLVIQLEKHRLIILTNVVEIVHDQKVLTIKILIKNIALKEKIQKKNVTDRDQEVQFHQKFIVLDEIAGYLILFNK